MSCFDPTNQPRPQIVQFTAIKDKKHSQILTTEKLKPWNFGAFLHEKWLKPWQLVLELTSQLKDESDGMFEAQNVNKWEEI